MQADQKPGQPPGSEALTFHPSKVAWATAEFIRKPPHYVAAMVPSLVAILIAVALVYGYVTRIPIAVEGTGMLVTERPPVPVHSLVAATVVKLGVHDNDLVRKGQNLLETDNAVSDASSAGVRRDVEALRRLLERDADGRCDTACERALRRASTTAFRQQLPAAARDSAQQVQELLRAFVSAKANARRSAGLLGEQRRQIRVAEEQLRVIRARQAGDVLATDVEALTSKIGSLRTDVAQTLAGLGLQSDQARDRLEVQLLALLPRIDEIKQSQTFHAPADGYVTGLSVSSPGQKITAGQIILSIVPKDAELIAEIDVSNKDVAKVKDDLPVKIKLDALPEREYGTVQGRVRQVAVAPNRAGEPGLPGGFKVRARFPEKALTRNGVTYPLRYGMTLNALVITERERLLYLGVKKLLNLKDAMLGAK